MELSAAAQSLLAAVVNRLMPGDDFPSGWEAGVGDYLARQLGQGGDLAEQFPFIQAGLEALAAEAAARSGGTGFTDMAAAAQDTLLAEVERGMVELDWPISPQAFMERLINLTAEGYYSDPGNGGNRDGRAWEMVGYRAGPAPAHHFAGPAPEIAIRPAALAEVEDEYEAVVIGAGAAGGIVACLLAEAGKRVLLLERGRWQPYPQVPGDHLRNHRLALYGHNTGPDLEGHPRVLVDTAGRAQRLAPHQGGYQNNAMGVGGGTRVYGGQAWRFLPADFRLASKYGRPEGSSLADWPISYDDLEPYYEQAEWQIGVAGDSDAPFYRGLRRRGYPMPPVPRNLKRTLMEQGAAKLGWGTASPPLLLNTRPYQGRSACVQCGMCVGFACPSESKNGTHNTMIPRALASGNCTLLCQTQVERITTDAQGRVTGVAFFSIEDGAVQQRTVRAGRVIVSAGAIESARLLLNSASSAHPAGLGNRFDQVGRNLQGHIYTGAFGLFAAEVEEGDGPGVSLATCDFSHDNPGLIGGGMLCNEFVKLPIIFWRTTLPPDLPRWGQANKQHMRDYFRRTLQIYGPIQEIPNPEARVTVDPQVRDRFGLPVARLSGTVHPESLRTAEFLRARAEDWLRACGPERSWSYPNHPGLSGGQHQAGTCRMGTDPQTSVTDAWGRVHGHDNLFVVDGSLHVTNGGFNPVLTIMALAFRCAGQIVATM